MAANPVSVQVSPLTVSNGHVFATIINWFTTRTPLLYDWSTQGVGRAMSEVTCVWCDNSQNENSITFTVQPFNQTFTVEGKMLAILPIVSTSIPKITVVNNEDGQQNKGMTTLIFADFSFSATEIYNAPQSVSLITAQLVFGNSAPQEVFVSLDPQRKTLVSGWFVYNYGASGSGTIYVTFLSEGAAAPTTNGGVPVAPGQTLHSKDLLQPGQLAGAVWVSPDQANPTESIAMVGIW